MSKDGFDKFVQEIGNLKRECEELRVRNEMLEYHLGREKRVVRELERELQELTATMGIRVPDFSRPEYDPPAPLGWGKGKDE